VWCRSPRRTEAALVLHAPLFLFGDSKYLQTSKQTCEQDCRTHQPRQPTVPEHDSSEDGCYQNHAPQARAERCEGLE
jgi:hypothetical protein